MVLVKTPSDFIDRSILLLQAHPNTTRITTTYHITPHQQPHPAIQTLPQKPTKSQNSHGVP
ncbi:hypothetical protein TWF481_004217 [Arthrobotrys musiformis]|uniref:SRP9 domain-containing protein n=1 Tax=Arthrobotrys musiformis TaxID=47236 RepID=A0AAV9WPM7_9PEZI